MARGFSSLLPRFFRRARAQYPPKARLLYAVCIYTVGRGLSASWPEVSRAPIYDFLSGFYIYTERGWESAAREISVNHVTRAARASLSPWILYLLSSSCALSSAFSIFFLLSRSRGVVLLSWMRERVSAGLQGGFMHGGWETGWEKQSCDYRFSDGESNYEMYLFKSLLGHFKVMYSSNIIWLLQVFVVD